jgi:hypothetical protein
LWWELQKLVQEKNIFVVDENKEEYIVDRICKRNTHSDNALDWDYVIKIRKAEGNCLKR